ncbi:MAG: endonuclease/exonuclease/phosphatase family protein [Fidelibacterota bacterium]
MALRKLFFLFLLLMLVMGGGCARQSDKYPIRVMTFNIRLDTPADSLNAWHYRKEMVASTVRFHKADLLGVQEALWNQMQDLATLLPEYDWLGVGRDDGARAGEFMAIFYRKERFQVTDHATFWLSETPEQPGRGWDAACNRVVTWAQFRDRQSRQKFFHFNTHFDHKGSLARLKSAELLLQQIAGIAQNESVIVTGDFNSTPTSEVYQILTRELTDSKKISQYPHHGSDGTFTWFDLQNLFNDQPIDYIFIKNNLKILYHGTLTDTFNGRLPSDHFPVLAEVILNPS